MARTVDGMGMGQRNLVVVGQAVAERVEYRHQKCGAVLSHSEDEPQIGPEQDCPVCVEVRKAKQQYGVDRATAGTPLAEELGLRVITGEVGLVGQ